MKLHKINEIHETVRQILEQVLQDEENRQYLIDNVHPDYRKSATNLINYLSLRSYDIRDLQRKLGYLGMSRLARAEGHVKASLQTTLFYLQRLSGLEATFPDDDYISIKAGEKLLARNTAGLLGEVPANRRLRIMVTIPSKAVKHPKLVEQMIAEGMNCARINCAHDGPKEWLKMIKHIRIASKKLQKHVVITMDVGGPKIRTGEIESGPAIKLFLPVRDQYGRVVHPATVHLVSHKSTQLKAEALPVDEAWLSQLVQDDVIRFKDTREKPRKLKVVEVSEDGVVGHSNDSAYIISGTKLKAAHGDALVGEVPPMDQAIFLKTNDRLVLHKTPVKGSPTRYDKKGNIISIAHISCTLPEALDYVEVGETVFFDDGEIQGKIEEKQQGQVTVKITRAKSGGARLMADKGINFPDSNLPIGGLTEKDREDLKFITKHADVVNFSFVNTPQDVADMLATLDSLGARDRLGIILKIETQRAFDNLTKILLEAMKSRKIGVMIARGDLAIEVGWERIGSIQKEILAICNASHVPVIWATQVLDTLAKKGLPSRSEITDAVNATKADCVMLNKGPYILEVIRLLDQIIQSYEVYQDKNAPMLPRLKKLAVRT